MSTATRPYTYVRGDPIPDWLLEDRAELAARFWWIASVVARSTDTPPWVPFDETESLCLEGLVEAAQRWDPARHEFVPYAWNVCRYRLIDGLRRDSGRARQKRGPPLERPLPLYDETTFTADLAAGPADLTVADDPGTWDALVAGLEGEDLWLVSQTYQHNRNQEDIGNELGVTASRICQRLTVIKKRLLRRARRLYD